MWKLSWFILRYYPGIYLEGLIITTNILSQDRWSPGRDWNPGPPEYEGVLTTRSRRLVWKIKQITTSLALLSRQRDRNNSDNMDGNTEDWFRSLTEYHWPGLRVLYKRRIIPHSADRTSRSVFTCSWYEFHAGILKQIDEWHTTVQFK
jgi:hypothetical protein